MRAAMSVAVRRLPDVDLFDAAQSTAQGLPEVGAGAPLAVRMRPTTLAEVAGQALSRPEGPARERALEGYPAAMKATYGGYYTLGRVFVSMIGNPQVMKVATKYGLPRPLLMKFTLKLLANLTDPRGGDALDRVVNGLVKVAPAA